MMMSLCLLLFSVFEDSLMNLFLVKNCAFVAFFEFAPCEEFRAWKDLESGQDSHYRLDLIKGSLSRFQFTKELNNGTFVLQ